MHPESQETGFFFCFVLLSGYFVILLDILDSA